MGSEIIKLGGAAYHPSAANSGNDAPTVLRGRNMWLRGSNGSFYFEAFRGVKDLNEPLAGIELTGTIDFTDGSLEVVGTGTAFRSELRFGQKFMSGEAGSLQVFVVEDVVDDTHVLVQRAPDATASGQAAFKPPHLFEIHNRRGSLVFGNALKFDRGNIVAVGEGQLKINGEVLPGETLWASRRMQIALYDETTEEYTISDMGYDSAPAASGCSISVVAGGTRDMTQGDYSFRWAWANSNTGYGFSNPSDVIKLDASNNPLAITATNQRFQLDFTTALLSKPTNADAVIVFRSMYSSAADNLVQAAEGSWYVAATVKVADFESGDIVYVDVLDGELGTEVSFDNDPPPNADWVSTLAGDPILISCYGDKQVGGDDLGEAPGPYVSPSRRGNRDGYPAAMATVLSPPEEIIGFYPAVGRLFLMTRVGLPFAASTGQSDFPVETRAFWNTRFKSPYGLVFFNDFLYAYTVTGATRSIGTADKGADQINFGAAVADITREWVPGYVHAAYDPQNECIIFIYSAAYRDDDGFWVSLALPYSLKHEAWMPLMELKKAGRDMVVTGACAIGSRLHFIAGGSAVEVEEPPVELPVDPEPLASGFLSCGFECGFVDNHGASDLAHVSAGAAATYVSISSSVKRTGKYSLRCQNTNTTQWTALIKIYGPSNTTTSNPVTVNRFYLYFETLPATSGYVYNARGVDATQLGLYFNSGDSKLYAASGVTPATKGATGATVTTGVWYCVDLYIDQTSGAREVRLQVDEAAYGTRTDAVASGDAQNPRFCNYGMLNTVGTWYFDDLVVSSDAADWPIGPGRVHAHRPSVDGSHNINAAGRFERGDTGTSISNSDTDVWDILNDAPLPGRYPPPANSGAVRMNAPGTSGDYIEIGFELDLEPGETAPEHAPRMVEAVAMIRHDSSVDTFPSETIAPIVRLVDNGSSSDIQTGATDSAYHLFVPISQMFRRNYQNPPSAANEWTGAAGNGNIDDVKMRIGTADDDAVLYLDGAILECEYSE
jgi:hypothetical protein